jgi:prolyl 4-hydroxylase
MLFIVSTIGIFIFVLVLYVCWMRPSTVMYEMDDFLTTAECDHIVEIAKKAQLHDSKVYSSKSDLYDTTVRKSEQAWLYDEDPVIRKMSEKVAKITRTDICLQEPLQVVHYHPGGFFRPHIDACDGNEEECKRMNGNQGPRHITVLVYLNDDYTGGETAFPKLGVTVTPKKGKAVVFHSVDSRGRILQDSQHGGNPVIQGEKWVCNKWVRLNN